MLVTISNVQPETGHNYKDNLEGIGSQFTLASDVDNKRDQNCGWLWVQIGFPSKFEGRETITRLVISHTSKYSGPKWLAWSAEARSGAASAVAAAAATADSSAKQAPLISKGG